MEPPLPVVVSLVEPENALKEFVWLVCNYEFSVGELIACGIEMEVFRNYVRLLRFQLIADGWIII